MNIYEYDEKLNIISILAKRWEEENWLNFGMVTFEYDLNNNCTLEIWKIANNNDWENWFRLFYEYDDNNNLIHIFGEEWENEQWVPENELLIITNPDGISFGYLAKEIFLYYSKTISVANEKNIATGFILQQNYPNPFNSITNINYQIPKSGFVQLKVYDILGKEVAILVNEIKSEGSYSVSFDASDLPSGIYIYSLRVNDFIQNNKMTLLK